MSARPSNIIAPPADTLRSVAELDQSLAAGDLTAWQAAAYSEFRAKVLDEAFPCTFGTVAQRRGEVLYAFIDAAATAHAADEAARIRSALVAYLERLRPLDAVQASLLPLVVLVAPPSGVQTVEDYFARGWALLRWLHAHDPSPWPAEIPRDPEDPRWTFCFGGRSLFVTFKTPLHKHRRSRQMNGAWAVLFQSRDGFDALAGDTAHGRRARARIRAKLAAYDDLPPSHALDHYGAPGNREWRQYFAPDGDSATDPAPFASRCPFPHAGGGRSLPTLLLLAGLAGGLGVGTPPITAQQTPPMVTPSVAEVPQVRMRLEVVAEGLETPWGMSFAPDGRLFVTERVGRIRVIARGKLQAAPWATIPVVHTRGAGLLGLAVAPDFVKSRAVYVAATVRAADGSLENRVVRFIDSAGVGVRPTVIRDGLPAFDVHAGSAVAFGPDGMLYVTVGDARQTERVGSPGWLGATILRLRPDGTVPADNPQPGSPIYARGLRNAEGLTWLNDGTLIATDHGPSDWPGERGLRDRDELNQIRAGGDYGWPRAAGMERADGATLPLVEWTPAIAPSGLAVYTGPVAAWRGSIFVAGLRGRQLRRVTLAPEGRGQYRVAQDERVPIDSIGRIRGVVMGPDRLLYLATSNREVGDPAQAAIEDRIYRVVPISASSSAAKSSASDVAATSFAPGIISNDSSYGVTFTPDGRTVYFTRIRADTMTAGRGVPTIMESRTEGGRWSPPRVASFAGPGREIDPFITADGRQLLFNSSRLGSVPPPMSADPSAIFTGLDIWAVDRLPTGGWSAARALPAPVNTPAPEFYATATRTGTVYFVSERPDGFGSLDLYRVRRQGQGYTEPENLGPPVNTAGPESNVFVDPDERYIIFFADRPGGYGRRDLYVSYRRGRTWDEPKNLGPIVNTPDLEFCPAVSPDGRTFYFSRIRSVEGQPPQYSIWSVPLDAVLPPR